jgi:hypothetical protein
MMLRMASRVCWHCGTKAHMTRVGEPIAPMGFGGRGQLLMAAYACDECHVMSIAIADYRGSGGSNLGPWLDVSTEISWQPRVGTGREFPDVPEHVGQAADEAYQCLSIGAHRGAASLARSVVEATAKEKGIKTGRLVEKIDKMYERGLIREHVRDGAHEVRYLGNDMAHGDFVEPVEREEAEEVLELMAEVLNEVFQSPARVERRKAARLAKKAGINGDGTTSASTDRSVTDGLTVPPTE